MSNTNQTVKKITKKQLKYKSSLTRDEAGKNVLNEFLKSKETGVVEELSTAEASEVIDKLLLIPSGIRNS